MCIRDSIIGDYRRMALYGIDRLIEAKKEDLRNLTGPMTEARIRLREEVAAPVSYTHLDVYKRQQYTLILNSLNTEIATSIQAYEIRPLSDRAIERACSAECFHPKPKVNSVLIKLTRHTTDVPDKYWKLYTYFVSPTPRCVVL